MKRLIKNISKLLMTATILTGILAGCSGAQNTKPAENTNTTEPSTTIVTENANSTTPELDKSKKLLIYSNSGKDGKGDWVVEKAKEAGFNVEYVDVSGGDLLTRVIAEKNNQMADIIWGLNAMSYEQIKNNDLLLKYDAPAWTSEVDMTLGDADGYYYPIVVQPLLMAYNTEIFPGDKAPKDWVEAVTKEDYKGKINVLALGGGTSQSLIAGMLVRYKDPNGELGISAEGWDVIKSYVQDNHVNLAEDDWFANFTSNKFPITGIWGSGYIQRKTEQNLTNIDFATPEIGVPFVVEQLAIIKNTKNPELAKAFIEWFGSAEIQGEFSKNFGTAPANKKALEMAAPEVKEMLERVKPQDIDWKFVGDNLESWMEKINLEYVK